MSEQQYRVIADRDKGDNLRGWMGIAEPKDRIVTELGDDYRIETVRIERPEWDRFDREVLGERPSLPTREQIAEVPRYRAVRIADGHTTPPWPAGERAQISDHSEWREEVRTADGWVPVSTQPPSRDELAEVIAKAEDADYWVDEIRQWEAQEAWEREAYIAESYPSMAYEDREAFRRTADAVLALLQKGADR